MVHAVFAFRLSATHSHTFDKPNKIFFITPTLEPVSCNQLKTRQLQPPWP